MIGSIIRHLVDALQTERGAGEQDGKPASPAEDELGEGPCRIEPGPVRPTTSSGPAAPIRLNPPASGVIKAHLAGEKPSAG
jgi:hypothetical protein